MENEYYTPTIEEFHIGFEYEYKSFIYEYQVEHLGGKSFKVLTNPKSKFDWVKCVFKGDDFLYFDDDQIQSNLNMFIEEKSIRIKYLDKEDIESFGFQHMIGYVYNLVDKNKGPFRLEYFENDNLLSIFYPEYYKNGEQLFKGIIKNKSELKVLLKQLNLYYGV